MKNFGKVLALMCVPMAIAGLGACSRESRAAGNDTPLWQGKKDIVIKKLLTIGADDLSRADYVLGGINDIAFDAENNIYILDYVNSRVSKFSYDGQFAGHFGKGVGQGPGQLQFPTGVCVDHEGHVYIADYKQRIIHVFNQSNVEIGVIRTEDNIRPIFGLAVSARGELFAGVDLAFSRWNGGLFQIFSIPRGKYMGSFGDSAWFLNHRNVMSGNNSIIVDREKGLILASHANPYQIDIFSDTRELLRSFGRKTDIFDKYVMDRNRNRIMAGTSVNLAYLPNGIIINVIRHMERSTSGSTVSRYFDFFNLDGAYLLTVPEKTFGIEGQYNLVFKSDGEGDIWASYNDPFPHLDKLRIGFRDR
jgi:hypothetical protein